MKHSFNRMFKKKKEQEKDLQKSFAETSSFGMGGAKSLQDAWEKWALFKDHLQHHVSEMRRDQSLDMSRLMSLDCALVHHHNN